MNRCQLPLEILPVENEGFHVFLYAMINETPARMLLDTGASKTVFDSNFITTTLSAAMSISDEQATGLGGNQLLSSTFLAHEFSLNHFVLNQFPFMALDLNAVNSAYSKLGLPGINGVLGSDLLHKLKAVIDFDATSLLIRF